MAGGDAKGLSFPSSAGEQFVKPLPGAQLELPAPSAGLLAWIWKLSDVGLT
jgi:hypothetical protein